MLMDKYLAYATYKKAKIEWFGLVPTEWILTRLKFEASINMGQSPNSDDCNQDGIGLPFLQGNAEFGVRSPSPKQYCEVPRKIADEGEFLFSVRAPVGALNVADQKYGIGRGLCSIKSQTDLLPSFLWWLIPVIRLELASVSTGSTFEAVSAEQVENVFLYKPSRTEQQKIANFLDHETTKIDTLIEKQQQLIKLLKEKRQAVISHAVTKGLNPNAPMRDSGVEWLGEVPAHWEVCRLKQVSSFITSGPRGWSVYLVEDGDEIFLQSGDLNDALGIKFSSANKVIPPRNAEGTRTKLKDGDVVVCITGANTGRVAVASRVPSVAYINQHLSLIRPKAVMMDSNYLGYTLSSSSLRSYFDITQYGLKEGLSLSNVAEAPVCCPPKVEQVEISRHIESIGGKYDDLESRAEAQIELLRERRTALISAAVTGKINVRNWQPTSHTSESLQEAAS